MQEENDFIIYVYKVFCLALSNCITKKSRSLFYDSEAHIFCPNKWSYRIHNLTFQSFFYSSLLSACACFKILFAFFLHLFWQHVFQLINFKFYCSYLVFVFPQKFLFLFLSSRIPQSPSYSPLCFTANCSSMRCKAFAFTHSKLDATTWVFPEWKFIQPLFRKI